MKKTALSYKPLYALFLYAILLSSQTINTVKAAPNKSHDQLKATAATTKKLNKTIIKEFISNIPKKDAFMSEVAYESLKNKAFPQIELFQITQIEDRDSIRDYDAEEQTWQHGMVEVFSDHHLTRHKHTETGEDFVLWHGDIWSARIKNGDFKQSPEKARNVKTITYFGKISDAKRMPNQYIVTLVVDFIKIEYKNGKEEFLNI